MALNGAEDFEDEEDFYNFNPFQLPSDDQVFLMRDREHKAKLAHREKMKKLKVWEKASLGKSRLSASAKRMLRDFEPTEDEENSDLQKKQAGQNLIAAATAAILKDRRHEKENMADFIAKKREMFLVQMSLDTKHEEIRKLEEKAQMKEEALKKSELMLEEDAIRFDTFLKENDKKAHEAIKKAEVETKKKQEKVQEIKRLNQQIMQVQSEMSKSNEILQHCLLYKDFLESLTPPEWFQAREEKAAAEAKKRRKAKGKHKGNEGKEEKDATTESKEDEENPDIDEDECNDGEDMYFTKASQLLDIFTQLEESNLFLIQNSQETEQALEELKQEFRDTKTSMDAKTKALRANIDELQQQIEEEEKKAESLRHRLQNRHGEDTQEGLLHQLHGKVMEVYRKCGFDCGASPATLTMLTDLEAKLEDLLSEIEHLPEEYVVKAEKAKEKERRERVRTERMAQQQAIYEERLRKSMERSMQAPKKKTGKPVMFRSAPPQKRKKKKDNDDAQKEDHTAQFFVW